MPSVFLDQAAPPTDAQVAKVLGTAAAAWKDVLASLEATSSWSWSGRTAGWILKVVRGKRAVVYLVPGEGAFTASFALGEKACAAAKDAGLPPGVLDLVARAPRYAEGRAVRLAVRAKTDLEPVLRLAALKAGR